MYETIEREKSIKLAKVINIDYLVKKQDELALKVDKFTEVLGMNYIFCLVTQFTK